MFKYSVVRDTHIRFSGSGDAFGSGGRLHTCIHVHSEDATFLIDCGASSLIAMKRFGIDPASIDAVLVTHLHGDHFGGIPFLVLDAQFVSRRTRPLTVAGPPDLQRRVHDAMEVLFPGSSRVRRRFSLEVIELPEGEAIDIGALTVTPYGVVHPSGAPAYALRVECGGKVVSAPRATAVVAGYLGGARREGGQVLSAMETIFPAAPAAEGFHSVTSTGREERQDTIEWRSVVESRRPSRANK